MARRLARGLADLGIGKGDVIGLHMPNIPQYMVALAAISRLGCGRVRRVAAAGPARTLPPDQ